MESALYTAGKIGGSVALNLALPGLASVIDIGEACYDIYHLDFVSASFNIASAVFNIYTVGVWSKFKDTARGLGKEAAINVAKQTAKDTTTQIGHAARKDIAKGMSKIAVVTGAKVASDKAKKDIGKKLAIEFSKKMVEETTERAAFEVTKSTLKDVTIESTKRVFLENGSKVMIDSVLLNGGNTAIMDIGKAILRDTADNFIKRTPRETFKSATSAATKAAAADFLRKQNEEMGKDLFKRTLRVGGVKSIVNLGVAVNKIRNSKK